MSKTNNTALASIPVVGAAQAALVSVANAAVYLDCSSDHVRRLMATGQIRYLDIGMGRAKIRIPLADLDGYVERNLRIAPKVVAS